MNVTREETVKLFNLLERLYPNQHITRDKTNLVIWENVLKPWSYEDVKEAVFKNSRIKAYKPIPSEIAALLPQLEPPAETAPPRPGGGENQWFREWADEFHRKLAENGLPTMAEALNAGMSPAEWDRVLKEAGV